MPAKTFKCDDSVLDPAIKAHLATFYAAVDDHDLESWANHFTEDAELKKEATNVKGRKTLQDMITASWEPLQSREHTVFAVFPFGPGALEVMLHGQSYNVYKDGSTKTFTWANRLCYERQADGKVLLAKYVIMPDYHPYTV